MPRLPTDLPRKLKSSKVHLEVKSPRLWNAKRRIKSSRAITLPFQHSLYKEINKTQVWRNRVSKDVVEYADKAELSPERRLELIRNPSRYFSRPHNVPTHLRTQVYFPRPNDLVTLFRTPGLPPKYASFNVPLRFNKLDLKSYLYSVYGVEVLHIRSTVVQQKPEREKSGYRGNSQQGQGRLKRPMAKKKMMVELVEPFVWPEELEDLSPWEQDTYWAGMKFGLARQRLASSDSVLKPNEVHRKSIAEQARELLEGKAVWKPTWTEIPHDVRVLQRSSSPLGGGVPPS